MSGEIHFGAGTRLKILVGEKVKMDIPAVVAAVCSYYINTL